jgi:hypothetical protein
LVTKVSNDIVVDFAFKSRIIIGGILSPNISRSLYYGGLDENDNHYWSSNGVGTMLTEIWLTKTLTSWKIYGFLTGAPETPYECESTDLPAWPDAATWGSPSHGTGAPTVAFLPVLASEMAAYVRTQIPSVILSKLPTGFVGSSPVIECVKTNLAL